MLRHHLRHQISPFVNRSSRNASSTVHIGNFAKFDMDRKERTAFPEVIYGEGKSPSHIADIIIGVHRSEAESKQAPGKLLLTTRITEAQFQAIESRILKSNSSVPIDLHYYADARLLKSSTGSSSAADIAGKKLKAKVSVLMAGTSDFAIAEECAVTLELSNIEVVERVYDVGVAGIYRLLDNLPRFSDSHVVIVCAGMDGALPSAVGGLVTCPIIAVPTSIGYGAAFGGLAPLLTMLNTCAPGVSVVNIDNGFGAAVIAYKMCHVMRTR